MSNIKFLCDQMLGNLSSWLRFFGFDTIYIKNYIEDDDLLEIAQKDNRIILTRDKELIIRSNKRKIKNIYVDNLDLDEQLITVLKDVKIDKKMILSRCSICNSLLDKIDKNKVQNKVPNKIFNNIDEFQICRNCDKVYWAGSHYDKIIKKIFKIEKLI